MGVKICCKKNDSIDNKTYLLQMNQNISITNNENVYLNTNSNSVLNNNNTNNKLIKIPQNKTNKQSPILTNTEEIKFSNISNSNQNLINKTRSENKKKTLEKKTAEHKTNVIRNKIKSKTLERGSVYLNRTFINLLILGDKNTGKTSYLNLIMNKNFCDNYIPTKEDEIHIEKIVVEQRKFNLNIIIMNKLKEKESINSNKDYYLLFYDINNMNSLNFIIKLYEDILSEFYKKVDKNLSNIIFIGNKIDIKKNDDVFNSMENFCNENQLNHFEISAKENKGIDELNKLLVKHFEKIDSKN